MKSYKSFKSTLFTLLLICVTTITHAQEYTKLNHDLRHYLTQVNDNEMVPLLVEGKSGEVESLIEEIEGHIRLNLAPLYSIEIPASTVKDFSQHEAIFQIDFSLSPGKSMSDTMLIQIRADKVNQLTAPLRDKYTGKGVLLGVIDSGIELEHDDFKDTTGKTRIIHVWDQGVAYDPQYKPGNYAYGVEWDSSHINLGISTHDDKAQEYGHGSNVTGAAASNGNASGNFKGVAPEVSIISVATDFNKPNWLQTVVESVDYIFKKADTLNMPCVINASVGTYVGSHDGKDIAARMIDQLIKQKNGRALVCAAGNSGAINYHLQHNPQGDTVFTWFQYHPQLLSGFGGIYFELWSDTADFNHMQFAIGADRAISQTQFELRGRTNFATAKNRLNQLYLDSIMSHDNNLLAYVTTYVEESQGRYKMEVAIFNPDSNQYRYRFESTGSGKADIWSSFNLFRTSEIIQTNLPTPSQWPPIAKYVKADSLQTVVSSFSCLPSVITVGNYVNRNTYVDVSGTPRNVGKVPGQISVNSSLGPNRNGDLKPDISSAGDYMFAAGRLATLNSAIQSEPAKVSQDSLHYRNGGTSMASPTVAGIVALLFEKCPKVSYLDVRSSLISSARSDQFTPNLPNPKWGYGKADAFQLLVQKEFSPTLNAFSANLCQGDSSILSLTNSYNNYLWSNQDTTVNITINQSGEYFAKVRNTQGCYSFSDTAKITVHPLPSSPTIVQSNDSLFINKLGQYQWYLNQSPLSGATQNTFKVLQSGNYYCVFTDTNGCSVFSDTVNMIISSLNYIKNTSKYNLFPNPSTGKVWLTASDNNELNQISIYSTKGTQVYQEKDIWFEQRYSIELSLLPKGVYFIKLYSEDQVIIEKLILE